MSIYQALVAQQTKIISEYKKYPTVEDAGKYTHTRLESLFHHS